ncbi:long-chain fatty alcohol dehydrogenase [Macroventuria anomochaeta]|uniref:Long-chain fatty alcohol dehydrogenase n=1 Tax=Macroventuria anomochaeta TaxID=301207 RepID=A0ACB6RHY8_9PLEO|nr:long-chain fatty alcohol dehydrogenase [Macroventuria anomochaeta]KAF2621453.1 long-chain fatty alcohol dehydrogenase [Macroventuria anomochaeta]
MSLPTEPVPPKATPLPPLPKEDPLTPAQWKTLLAITDACIPAVKPISVANTRTEIAATDTDYSTALSTLRELTPESDPDATVAAKEYLEDYASSNPAFKQELQRIFALYMPSSTRKELIMVLNVLNTRAGSFALTGYFTPISEQPVHIREAILRSWGSARLGTIRGLHRSLTVLSKQTWIKITPTLRRVLGVPRVPTGMIPGKGYDYEFIQFPPGDKPEVIETDVVVIGSGCGGAVCAKNLAEAGNRVLVVEKAYHWTPDHFPMSEADGWNHLFMNGAFISSDDTSTSIVAGQAWGGGGTVNWSASLQTQGYVRREWMERGLPFFTSAEFQESLDRVCGRMGVSAEYLEQNRTNAMLLEGARKLGYNHKAVPQNTGGAQHRCGHCTFGCGSCEKQGPVNSYLPDAARAGAKFIEGFHAERVVFKTIGGKKVATGVIGSWVSRDINGGVAGEPTTRRKVIIKAKRVIASAGTMQSPLLLLRSGLKNPQIGRNLYVHPVTLLGAIHQEEIKPWEGAILTSVVGEYENLDGRGHGAKLEATNMIPSSWLIWLDWKGGLQYKLDAARMKHMAGYISICKDRDTGRVYPDPVDGRVRFSYTPSKFDKKHIMQGLLALAKIQYVNGASEIFTAIPGVSVFKRDSGLPATGDGINDERFQAWLDEVQTTGFPRPESLFISAHQMGTCRMSKVEKEGVVDPTGKVWGTEGLYVADASVFPSASGVNPMVTNMAISDWISRGVADGLVSRALL